MKTITEIGFAYFYSYYQIRQELLIHGLTVTRTEITFFLKIDSNSHNVKNNVLSTSKRLKDGVKDF